MKRLNEDNQAIYYHQLILAKHRCNFMVCLLFRITGCLTNLKPNSPVKSSGARLDPEFGTQEKPHSICVARSSSDTKPLLLALRPQLNHIAGN